MESLCQQNLRCGQHVVRLVSQRVVYIAMSQQRTAIPVGDPLRTGPGMAEGGTAPEDPGAADHAPGAGFSCPRRRAVPAAAGTHRPPPGPEPCRGIRHTRHGPASAGPAPGQADRAAILAGTRISPLSLEGTGENPPCPGKACRSDAPGVPVRSEPHAPCPAAASFSARRCRATASSRWRSMGKRVRNWLKSRRPRTRNWQ